MRSTRAFLIGVATAYLFDPQLGQRRRNVARDRGAKELRRLTRAAGKKARFATGKAQGVYARGLQLVMRPERETDDATVEQRIRSEAFRDVGVSSGEIEVDVEAGVASLSGPVASDELASELVARVSRVPGVEGVASTLRVGGAGPNRDSGR